MPKEKEKKREPYLAIWLSFEGRKIFLETVLKYSSYTFATLAARLQLLQVGDVLKATLLAWSGSLDLRTAVVSGISVSSQSTCILFWLDSVPSDFYNSIHRYHLNFVANPYEYYVYCR